MARVNIHLKHHQVSISHVGFGIGSLILCALALFMCANHSRRKWRKWKACYGYGDQEPVIQLNPEQVDGYPFGGGDPSAYSGESSVWQKNILMGGKCQLPEFSGVILYDSAGNIVTPARNQRALPALTWK